MKRLAATILWFFAGWYLAAVAAWLTGMPSAIAPIFAIITAAVIWTDPRKRLWVESAPIAEATDPSTTPTTVAGLIH
jgi:hypothetical protein